MRSLANNGLHARYCFGKRLTAACSAINPAIFRQRLVYQLLSLNSHSNCYAMPGRNRLPSSLHHWLRLFQTRMRRDYGALHHVCAIVFPHENCMAGSGYAGLFSERYKRRSVEGIRQVFVYVFLYCGRRPYKIKKAHKGPFHVGGLKY